MGVPLGWLSPPPVSGASLTCLWALWSCRAESTDSRPGGWTSSPDPWGSPACPSLNVAFREAVPRPLEGPPSFSAHSHTLRAQGRPCPRGKEGAGLSPSAPHATSGREDVNVLGGAGLLVLQAAGHHAVVVAEPQVVFLTRVAECHKLCRHRKRRFTRALWGRVRTAHASHRSRTTPLRRVPVCLWDPAEGRELLPSGFLLPAGS